MVLKWKANLRLLGLSTVLLIASSAMNPNAMGQATVAALPDDCSAYASTPLPAEAANVPVPKESPACASYRSYRGLGRPVNYSAARACAWRERLAQQAHFAQNEKEGTAWVVGGSLILADIYFNGAGVKRNVPLAMRFACEFEEGAAKFSLPDIKKINGSLPAHRPFEFCDYAATTFTEDFCAGYEAQIADDRRDRYYNSLKSGMTTEQRVAFERLLAAEKAYVSAHDFEVYQGGTIRVIRTIRSEEILDDLFHTEIVHFERRKWPRLSEEQIKTADEMLDREHEAKLEQLRGQTTEDIEDGAVTAKDLSQGEASWRPYRDAWTNFARLRYPSETAAVRAQITLDRYRLVKTIGP